jgi:prepilin-type processing-associated H-X9-DG protein
MSNTAAVAEWLIGQSRALDRRRTLYQSTAAGPLARDEFAAHCLALSEMSPGIFSQIKGRGWYAGSWHKTLYDHFLSINSPGCINSARSEVLGTCTAGSLHPGGANVLFCDGHARFIREGIATVVWRALGTRSGGEVISADSS